MITRVYQVIGMKPKACFENIRDEVVGHRRKADSNPDYRSAGESWKTLGNSLYGNAMTNKEKHKTCKIVLDEKVDRYVNDPSSIHVHVQVHVQQMEPIGDVAFKVQMDKCKIKIDLPLTVVFFVYHYSKLRMSEFVYDFLKKYLRPGVVPDDLL